MKAEIRKADAGAPTRDASNPLNRKVELTTPPKVATTAAAPKAR